MNAVKLYQSKSRVALLELMQEIETDPANQMPQGSLYRFNEKARQKLAAIAQAITWQLADSRAAAGNPVLGNGYSGRQSNRR